jgi:tetratricopeptide (TPR) repeat protein
LPLRESFELHVVREISVREIAAQLKLSPVNVRKRVQLARAHLRREIGNRRHANGNTVPVKNRTPSAAPVCPVRQQPEGWQPFSETACMRTVCVKLPCGADQLFHVFSTKAPFALDRKMKLLQRQVRQVPDDWKKRLELAELFHATGDWENAVGEWQIVPANHLPLPAALKLGDTLLKLGAHETAASVFELARRHSFQSAAKLGWEKFVPWHGLTFGHLQGDNLPNALAGIRHALELNPDDRMALSVGHELLLAAGDLEEAVRRSLHLLKLTPHDLLTLRRLVDCRCQLGLTRGAAGQETTRLLRRTLRLSRNTFLIHETLASFLLAQGKPEKALAVYREFAAAHPQCLRGRQNYLLPLGANGFPTPRSPEPGVWKLPTVMYCHGACPGFKPTGLLRT